jgi:formate/nitrite transporter FocA (FNT family)
MQTPECGLQKTSTHGGCCAPEKSAYEWSEWDRKGKGKEMTANAMLGVIGTMIGGAACFCLGYHCALRWVASELERMKREEEE